MTTEQRTAALLFWINKFGDQTGLNLRPCTQLITVWCAHLPSITHFCLTGNLARKTAFSPKDAYKEAKEMLSRAFDIRRTHKHLVKQLSSSQAAKGDEKEIYKFLVLITFHIAICHEDMICKFRHELKMEGLEDVLGRVLQQCCDNILGDSWFSVEMTPILQRKSFSAVKNREEVYTNITLNGDLNNTLSSPSFQKLRQKNIVIEKLEQENNVLRNQCEKNVLKVNSYKEYLEDAEQQKESVSTALRSRIHELNSDEKKLRMENKILLREKSSLEHEMCVREQTILDLSKELKELKLTLTDAKAEAQRVQQINNQLRGTSDSLEITLRSLRKQLDEARETIALNAIKLNEPKAELEKLKEKCDQMRRTDKENKDEIKYLREELLALTSSNSDYKRRFLTLENQLQNCEQRVQNMTRDLDNEKKNNINILREQESNHTRLVERERDINRDLTNQLRQAREKSRDITELYNTNIVNEKNTSAIYKKSKEDAEQKLQSLRREWEEQTELNKAAHKREIDALRELKDYHEKKCDEVLHEMDELRESLANLGDMGSRTDLRIYHSSHELRLVKQLLDNKDDEIKSLHEKFDGENWCRERESIVTKELICDYENKLRNLNELVRYAFALMNSEASKMESCLVDLDRVFDENESLKNQLRFCNIKA